MLSALINIASSLLNSLNGKARYLAAGAAAGALVAWLAAAYIYGGKVAELQSKQWAFETAMAARATQAEKAAKVIEERYEETLKTAAAVARGNASVIERLRNEISASKRRTTCTANDKAKFERTASAAADLAEWSIDCARRVTELEAQIVALQSWIRTNM